MKTLVIEKEKISAMVADIIKDEIDEILVEKDFVVLGVPGGRSVESVYNELAKRDIPWEKVHLFMVDERKVKLDDKESNFKILDDTLLSAVEVPEGNVHPFKIEEGISSYKDELDRYGSVFDIILLSSGEDGHVGALAPEHHSVEDESESFIEMDDSPKPPLKRMTMSRKLLMRSKAAILLFIGEGKKEAYSLFRDAGVTYEQCPAKLVQDLPRCYVLTDIRS